MEQQQWHTEINDPVRSICVLLICMAACWVLTILAVTFIWWVIT